jgi:hypothetical protein
VTAHAQYDLLLTFYNRGFDYRLNGCHDRFPNHEVYLNGQPILTDEWTFFLDLLFCAAVTPRIGAIR